MPPEPVCPLTVEQYYALLFADKLPEEPRTELLEGWVVPKMTFRPPHSVSVGLFGDALRDSLPAGWCVRTQASVRLEESVPEPDGSVVRGKLRNYVTMHPRAKDVGVLAEISDTTLKRDRGLKKRVYARARIPVYWIINLRDYLVEVYTSPTGPTKKPTYRQCRVYKPGESIPLLLEGKVVAQIAVDDLLP
jgi:Uma2 family endonuclease